MYNIFCFTKLQKIPIEQRGAGVNSMTFEASARVRDPVYGCVAVISQLHQQISEVQHELAKTQGELALYTAQQVQQQQMVRTQGHYGESSWLGGANAVQDGCTFQLNQLSLIDLLQLQHEV
ncbi:hypothetical protein GIB67_013363 [Kingdonia uniflora]|uniref:LOB domain-containing protein n=1 Tax=Kingdonia uniflora TaxID=39325 RepID=A0A7J7LR36_9MAGN|nr:hypothetical protein GIB67_013363 [Kingdonia uniflora]